MQPRGHTGDRVSRFLRGGDVRLSNARLGDLARDVDTTGGSGEWVARTIARSRLGNSPQYLDAWEERRQGGPEHPADRRDVLAAHIASESIGTPDEPAAQSHLQGLVAEYVWYEAVRQGEIPVETEIVRIEEPSWSVSDAGGDGLVIFNFDRELRFCIWESKAHEGESDVRDVVSGACRQLDKKAIRYLARMSKIGQSFLDGDLRVFYGRLAELWRNQTDTAAGGVSVTTKHSDVDDCFDNLGSYWSFEGSRQRQGIVVVIDDFPSFAAGVRERLWSGL